MIVSESVHIRYTSDIRSWIRETDSKEKKIKENCDVSLAISLFSIRFLCCCCCFNLTMNILFSLLSIQFQSRHSRTFKFGLWNWCCCWCWWWCCCYWDEWISFRFDFFTKLGNNETNRISCLTYIYALCAQKIWMKIYETININILEVMNDSDGSIFLNANGKQQHPKKQKKKNFCAVIHFALGRILSQFFFSLPLLFSFFFPYVQHVPCTSSVTLIPPLNCKWYGFAGKLNMHLTFTWCWRLHNTHLSVGYWFALSMYSPSD